MPSDFDREICDNACRSFNNNKQYIEEHQIIFITSNTLNIKKCIANRNEKEN